MHLDMGELKANHEVEYMARGNYRDPSINPLSPSQSFLPRRATRIISTKTTHDEFLMEDNPDAKLVIPTRTPRPSRVPVRGISRRPLKNSFLLTEDDFDAASINVPLPASPPRSRLSSISINRPRRAPRHQLRLTNIFLFLSIICIAVFVALKISLIQRMINLFTDFIEIFQQQGITNVLQNIASIVTIVTAILLPISAFLWKRLKKHRKS
ncbi:MAG TPA: hypothetical protein VFV38_48820 [Ktedonobacteraceae bacterium]|nr:hypothetical protein [Ktedonobacteraceae bacterium]